MNQHYSKTKTNLRELPKISDRVSFIYIEHSKISRQDGAITVVDQQGIIKIPVAMIGVLFLGPGTEITHRAMELIGDMGASVVWVGEQGVRHYAHGRALARTTHLLEKQAKLVSNMRTRLAIARHMYQHRFPDEDVSNLTMQQLRGREGARVRSLYRSYAKKHGVEWERRDYNPKDFHSGTPINQALSVANVALYGVCHSVIVALGMSPGLGFIHTGHERAFVYDVADLYKADYSIPIAFKCVSELKEDEDLSRKVRLAMRNLFYERKITKIIVQDLQTLMDVPEIEQIKLDIVKLWDDRQGLQSYGVNYYEREE